MDRYRLVAVALWFAWVLVPSSATAQVRCTVPSAGCTPRVPQASSPVQQPDRRPQPIGPLKLEWPSAPQGEQPQPFGPLKLVYPGTQSQPTVIQFGQYAGGQYRNVPPVRPYGFSQTGVGFGGGWGPYVSYQPSEHDLWAREWWRRPIDGVPLDAPRSPRTTQVVITRVVTARQFERLVYEQRLEEARLGVMSAMQPSALVEAARGAARQRCAAIAEAEAQQACFTGLEQR